MAGERAKGNDVQPSRLLTSLGVATCALFGCRSSPPVVEGRLLGVYGGEVFDRDGLPENVARIHLSPDRVFAGDDDHFGTRYGMDGVECDNPSVLLGRLVSEEGVVSVSAIVMCYGKSHALAGGELGIEPIIDFCVHHNLDLFADVRRNLRVIDSRGAKVYPPLRWIVAAQ